MDQLEVLRADIEPKATEHIPEMLALIQTLIGAGKAYATPSGDVYFRVAAFRDYGKLSHRSLDEMQAGARVMPGEEKENPLDFALWKAAKPGEPFWESPWGQGRPGWHIECSAMSQKYCPLPLDIHGGGQDLIFPHHENEIAQTEAALPPPGCGCAHEQGKFCNYWVHNGFVTLNSEKMSKSKGNFKTIRDLLQEYLPEALRFFLLARHYRSPVDFSFEAMEDAEKNLQRIYQGLEAMQTVLNRNKWSQAGPDAGLTAELQNIAAGFDASMADDLNTAAALGYANNMLRLSNRILEDKALVKTATGRDLLTEISLAFKKWGSVLGLFTHAPASFLADLKQLKARRKNIDLERVADFIAQRQRARQNKDFEQADAIRARLNALGVELRDTPEGMVWDLF
jgi:cysteinyl-tRNA synthetase